MQCTAPLPHPMRAPKRPQAVRHLQWWEVRESLMLALFLPTALFFFALRVEGLL